MVVKPFMLKNPRFLAPRKSLIFVGKRFLSQKIKKMKAIILAAGYGTRLGDVAKDFPKAFMKINNKPIINYALDRINEIPEIDKIIIITNNKFFSVFEEWKSQVLQEKPIVIVNDNTNSNEERLGALGDLIFAFDAENINNDILVLASDNLFDFNLREFSEKNRDSVGVYELSKEIIKNKYGVVEIDENGKMIGFQEKPEIPKTNFASTGIYLFKKETIPLIRKYAKEGHSLEGPGKLLEWLYKEKDVYAHIFHGKWFDIGSLEELEKAKNEFWD